MNHKVKLSTETEAVLRLREKTGATIPECIKAVRTYGNDKEAAIKWLREIHSSPHYGHML